MAGEKPQKRPKMMGVGAAVRKAFSDRPGVDLYLTELEALLPNLRRDQIQAAVSHRRTAKDPIHVIVPGQCWRWMPNVQPTEKVVDERPPDLCLMRVVGTLEGSNRVVLQDADPPHRVYLAERLGVSDGH